MVNCRTFPFLPPPVEFSAGIWSIASWFKSLRWLAALMSLICSKHRELQGNTVALLCFYVYIYTCLYVQYSQILWVVVVNESYHFGNASKELGLIYLIHFRVQFVPPQWKWICKLVTVSQIILLGMWVSSSTLQQKTCMIRFRSGHW